MVGVLATVLGGATAASAEIHHRAVVSTGASGAASVRLGARVVWRASSPRTRVASDVVWSRAGDAVAFATRDAAGHMKLLVVMVGGDLHGQVVSFAIPSRAGTPRRPVVTWLDSQRVLVGESELEPALVASWKVASR
jgi:hypothetical protein